MKKSELVREMILDNGINTVHDAFIKEVQEVTGFSRALARTYVKNNINKLIAEGKLQPAAIVEEVAPAASEVVEEHAAA